MVKYSLFRFTLGASVFAYLGLLFAEYLRPGFVSSAMNVHTLWLVIFPLMIFEGTRLNIPTTHRSMFQTVRTWFVLAILGAVLGMIAWHLGGDFGSMRFWFACIVAITPVVLFKTYR